MRKFFLGHNVPPRLVAAVRGIVEAVLLFALSQILINLQGAHLSEQWQILVPVAYWVIRYLEGEIDQKVDPSKNRTSENG